LRRHWLSGRELGSAALAVASAFLLVGAGARATADYKSGLFVASASTARLLPGVPAFHKPSAGDDLNVDAVVSDGKGGWYVGGDFTEVDATPCMNLVHVRLGQSITPASCFATNGTVLALALQGRKLFIGGLFTEIRAHKRNYLAAVDVTNDSLSSWDAHLAHRRVAVHGGFQGPYVQAIAVSPRVVYVGGQLLGQAGALRDVPAFDVVTARPAPGWRSVQLSTPKTRPYAEIAALALSGHRLVVAAAYPSATVESDADTGRILARAQPIHSGDGNGPFIDALAATGSTVYIAGEFTQIGNVRRSAVAALDPRTMRPTGWHAHIPGRSTSGFGSTISAIVVQRGRVYVAGDFYSPREIVGVAAFDPVSGHRLPWIVSGKNFSPIVFDALAVTRNTVAFGTGECKIDQNGCSSPNP